MAEYLDLGSQTPDATTPNRPLTGEAAHRIRPLSITSDPLDAVPGFIEAHGVDVDAAVVRGSEHEDFG